MKKIIEAVQDRISGKAPLLSRRSPKWHHVRDEFLKSHPTCEACGGGDNLQVHHVVPFHIDSSKELDPTNFITLCEGSRECHLKIGHNGNFRNDNPNVRADAEALMKSLSSPGTSSPSK